MSTSKKHYHIITIGCQMNENDSERIASYLEDLGFAWTEKIADADIAVLTTCGVRQSAEDRVYGLVANIKREKPAAKVVLTGCLSGRADVRERLKDVVDVWLPITELPSLEGKLGLKTEDDTSLSGYFQIQPKYGSTWSAFVPIGNGCNNFCSYCVVPYARGREIYREADEVLSEVRELVKRGYKEITLIAQNVNSYRSGHYDFARLLKEVNDVPGAFWLRYATSHPKDMSDELIEVMTKCEKFCHHIHLPAQAGDNEILSRMNRRYTREHYLDLIGKIRKALPDASISTDIIVGFPGETEAQFENTARLFREANFDMAYLAQYSPRPGTAAEKLEDDVSREEKKRREEYLNDILSETALSNNQAYQDQIVEVLIDEKKKEIHIGRTKTGKTIRVMTDRTENLIGQIVKVKITEVQDFGMKGDVIASD